MSTLETSRICIIDDEVNEYLPLIYALSQLRLGCIHVSGDRIEELPKQPLEGIRLVFLDMQLGTAGDIGQITAQTANVFGNVISSDDGPILVIIWTKHADYIPEFRTRLYERFEGFRGKLVFIRLEKPATLQVDDTIGLQEAARRLREFVPALRESIEGALSKSYPIELLWRWEQLAHDAASATTGAIAHLARNRANIQVGDPEDEEFSKSLAGLSEILRMLIDAEAAGNADTKTAFRDLMNVLNPLHQDRLEHALNDKDFPAAERLLDLARPAPNPEEAVDLNTMLLLSPQVSDYSPYRPGTLLRVHDPDHFNERWGCSLMSIATEFLKRRDKTKDLEKQLDQADLEEQTKQRLTQEIETERSRIQKWIAECIPILLEITPSCDFAQGNLRLAKFVAGLLVPSSAKANLKNDGGAFKHLIKTDLTIPVLEANYIVVFCSRFVFGIDPSCETEQELSALCRVREAALTEVRNWVGAQSIRSGFLSVATTDR